MKNYSKYFNKIEDINNVTDTVHRDIKIYYCLPLALNWYVIGLNRSMVVFKLNGIYLNFIFTEYGTLF